LSLKNILRGIPLFKNLTDEDLDLIASRLRKEDHPKGNILFEEGDPGDAMYLVESGQLAVVGQKHGEHIALIGPGNFVGDISLILAQPRTATVQVTIDAQLWLLEKKDFDDLITTRPSIALEMMRELSRRLVTTTRRKRQMITRRITALSGSHKGPELSQAIHAHLKSPVALLPLPRAKVDKSTQMHLGVMILDSQELTESGLAESLSHQIEVYKHIVLILPDEPDSLARKAVDLADTVVSIDYAPDWLVSGEPDQELWVINDTEDDLLRTARKLTNRTVGLALSSGGTRGLAHVGVLKVLMEENIPLDMVAGSSAGALFGALFAAGWSIERIEAYIQTLKNLTRLSNWDFNIPPLTGLVKGRRAKEKFLSRPLKEPTFADLKIPLYIVASDILTGDEVVFESGYVADAIRASASIPVLGEPWQNRGRFLVDGGVVNPLPASVLRDRGADIVIASNVVQPLRESYSGPRDKMPNIGQIIFNIISAMEAEMIKKQLPLIDVLIHHSISAKHTLDFEQVNEVVRMGEDAARQMLPAIKRVLESPPKD
jgi:predicted acylesterase/phospholipase RssA/CRP-like cAMP-binding protein